MNFLPYEDITYKTKLTPQEVTSRLSKHIKPDGWTKRRYKYRGNIEGNTFEISPITKRTLGRQSSRTSFDIIGELSTKNGETIIDMKIRLKSYTKGFFIFWYSFLLVGLIILLVEPPGINIDEDLSVFHIIVFSLLGYVVMIYGINVDGDKVKIHLLRLFEGTIVHPS